MWFWPCLYACVGHVTLAAVFISSHAYLAMFKYFVGPVILWPYLQFCLAYILWVMAFTQPYGLAMFVSVCVGLVTSAIVLLSVVSFWPCLELFLFWLCNLGHCYCYQ